MSEISKEQMLLELFESYYQGKCPDCGKQTLKKLPCRVHARFYGSGFYRPNKKEG